MFNEIIVPSVDKGLHFGSVSGYERFKKSWFEQKVFDDNNFIYKSLIFDIRYEPCKVYSTTDGYGGTCWVADIFDSDDEASFTHYYFRNFEDLVDLYDKKGYKFIEK